MASKTVNQFKALFPASATPSKLLSDKFSVELKFLSDWGNNTLDDLKRLVGRFGVPGSHLHLSKISDGCIAVIWLCSTFFFKELKTAIVEATDLLHTKGVLKVTIEWDLVLKCSQPDQGTLTIALLPCAQYACAEGYVIGHICAYVYILCLKLLVVWCLASQKMSRKVLMLLSFALTRCECGM